MNSKPHILKLFAIAIMALLLNACSVTGMGPLARVYCDNFLVYDICAQDLNSDGVVEYVYFKDSLEVFMYREGSADSIPDEHNLHRCVLPMDEGLVATTNRVFQVTDETTYLEKQDIRGAMMIKYIAYMPRVTACNLRAKQAQEAGET
jgi:hypothetical protein